MLDKQSCNALNAQRDEAMSIFSRQGFPTKKVERYRYTDVAEAFAPNYGMSLTPYEIRNVEYVYPAKQAPIDITPYYNKIAMEPNLGNVCDSNVISPEYDSLTALNTALAHDALVIYVPKGQKANAPIRIENILSGNQDTMVVRRVLIIMEECAEATIFFVDHTTPSPSQGGENRAPQYITSQVIECFCKDGSRLDMYELEETSENCNRFSNLYVKMGRDCTVRHNNITLNNGLTRNGIDVVMAGEGSEVTLNGAVIADRSQHVDNSTLIDHRVSNCTSNELYKCVLDDKARCAFAGRILVREGAQQTYSQETNNNMVASDDARMYTQPMLEIYADDVKCSHGSTVGVMDDAAIFYMGQRGIPETVARTLLKNAFISQVVDEMKWESFRDRLHILVDKRLSKEERCGTCKICG